MILGGTDVFPEQNPLYWTYYVFYFTIVSFKPIQDEEEKKASRTSFSHVTSTNVGISPKTFLTFSFNPFATWCKISSLHLQ